MPRFWANRTWSWKWVRIPLLVISLSCTPSQGFGTADVVASGRAMVPSCGGIFDLCGYSDRQSGKELIPKLFERAILFSEGLAAVRMNGLFGYIDTTGKVVIEPRFDLAGPFHDGFAEILVGQQTGVVSESGEVVLEPQFGRSTPIMGDVLIVRKGHFRPKRPPELEELESFDGLYTEYGPMGLYSLRKGWLTEETYEFRRFERGRPGYVWARDLRAKQSRFGLMNNEGEWKVEPMFDTVQPLFDGRAVVSVKVKDTETRRQLWGAVDADGKLAIPIAYDWLSYWDQGYSVARLNGEEGFLDTGGSLLGGRFFEKVERDLQGKPLKVQLDGKWFGITADGRLVDVPEEKPFPFRTGKLPAPSKNTQCKSGVSIISKDGDWGLRGPDERMLVDAKFEAISCFRSGIAWVPDATKNAWCPIGPDGKGRSRPDCRPTYYEYKLPHYYPEELDPDPFRSSVLWMRAYLKHGVDPLYPPPKLIGDGVQGTGTISVSCRDMIGCD
ncbi:WG repeat-containing protein [Rhizobium bangladeshense]|uniref:WG repeat-containing protein n=1 Tax=Rhizobium bangladeshense TaxID=1138189 RepID=UPI001C83487E|nr:WG repeat-containing protein [Rhizobium bangladeshense]MBX4919718.1 WG repeat-containing protein [Rhizobium bangladeshense]